LLQELDDLRNEVGVLIAGMRGDRERMLPVHDRAFTPPATLPGKRGGRIVETNGGGNPLAHRQGMGNPIGMRQAGGKR
jgi:hypothetical protein